MNIQGMTEQLRRLNAKVAKGDKELEEEGRAAAKAIDREARSAFPGTRDAFAQESIIYRRKRPVLAIKRNKAVLQFNDADDSKIWKQRLTAASSVLNPAIKAVGRIEVTGHELGWIGTGWVVKDNIVVTNRHVANEFAARRGEGFVFRPARGTNGSSNGTMRASVDFLREVDRDDELAFTIKRVLHIEPESGVDLAFLEVEPRKGSKLATPIALSGRKPGPVKGVAAIGYPARDSRIPDFALMDAIFSDVYDKKRLAPGEVTGNDTTRIFHDCSTLGGNSGSVIVDLSSGEALGVHFGGRFTESNYAVSADIVKKRLGELRGKPRTNGVTKPEASNGTTSTSTSTTSTTLIASANADDIQVRLPLEVTVSVGRALAQKATTGEFPLIEIEDIGDERPGIIEDPDTEAKGKGTDLSKRKGYLADFIGPGTLNVPLPDIGKHDDDALRYGEDDDIVLRYEHFSVVMSTSRRMCRFSAVNIDGKKSGKTGRGQWKIDRRIPEEQQIIKECYGNPPRFSRGHMTRREDPAWGNEEMSQRGSDDSMYVTNAVPQMQAFNSPIWLALEDYALQNARKDKMKISVFTGPYLTDDDPEIYKVKVPVRFWKIIAFIHDETGKLCATGYEMSQDKSLPKRREQEDEEFVFTQFVSPHTNIATQVAIATIERRSGLKFGKLSKVDPFDDVEEAREGAARPLLSLEQVRFIRVDR